MVAQQQNSAERFALYIFFRTFDTLYTYIVIFADEE